MPEYLKVHNNNFIASFLIECPLYICQVKHKLDLYIPCNTLLRPHAERGKHLLDTKCIMSPDLELQFYKVIEI